jgi:hypothetical protein
MESLCRVARQSGGRGMAAAAGWCRRASTCASGGCRTSRGRLASRC